MKRATRPPPAKDDSWAAFIPSPVGGGLLGSGTSGEQEGPAKIPNWLEPVKRKREAGGARSLHPRCARPPLPGRSSAAAFISVQSMQKSAQEHT